jgi:endonuclease YncB( thermonuclease family)
MYLNKKNLFLVSSLALIFLFLLNISNAKSSEIKIVDGDTIHINGEKIRFSGIDTPELKQTCITNKEIFFCGIGSKNLLAKIINNRDVNCISEGKDQYKRTLAECFVGDLSISRYLVREGYAFAYRKYSKKFVKDEEFAKENNKGMWSMSFEYPWEYRKKN